MMTQEEKPFPADAISCREAATILKGSRSMVYRMVREGRLFGWRISGTRVFVSEAEVRYQIQPVNVQERERTEAQAVAAAHAAIAVLREKGYRV